MTDVILERTWHTSRTSREIHDLATGKGSCLELYRVIPHGSWLSLDAKKMVCHLSGPDAEACRVALRHAQADSREFWISTVHDSTQVAGADAAAASVMVARRFSVPTTLDDVRAHDDTGLLGQGARRVRCVRSFVSVDRRRMLCLYAAPDVESVRRVQALTGMGGESVWGFRGL